MTDALPFALEVLCSALMVAGGLFALIGALGLVRLRSFMQRLHAPTKASTLGVGGVLAASMVYSVGTQTGWVLHEILITVFVFLSAPVAAHALASAASAPTPCAPPAPAEPPSDRS